jgi:exonuclease III
LEQMKIAVWNVWGINHKYNELLNVEVDTGMIWETKKKLKSMGELEYYCLIYSSVIQGQQATACVAIMINNKLKNRIYSSSYVHEKNRYYMPENRRGI